MRKTHKALFCCGSRPELIKISPVYHNLKSIPQITTLLCNTGQHRDLLPPHLDHLHITPDFQLTVMHDRQDLDALMEQLFLQLPQVIDQAKPDMMIIQGDTASTLAAAIIARKENIPIAHIEAGLRTHDKKSPFPEEIYRQNISALAQWHFCPTQRARLNLLQEGISDETIAVTGNTSVDMVLSTYDKLSPDDRPIPAGRSDHTRPFFLITLHRRESQGTPLKNITACLLEFTKSAAEYDFIIPLHPNPTTSNMIKKTLGEQKNIFLIPPVVYPEFVHLMAKAYAIITDSGGIQEEAPSLHTPVIVVRNKTERQEGVDNGCLRLAGTERNTILRELNLLITDQAYYKSMQQSPNPFGDGLAAKRITRHLVHIMKNNKLDTKAENLENSVKI